MAPSVLAPEQLVLESPVPLKTSTPDIMADPNHEEYQYLNLIREILETGEHRPDR